ncbi:MAG: SxtJ family membrane protein [Sedimenticola sp.]
MELRDFGLLTSGLMVVFFGFLIPWIWGLNYPYWPWVVAGVIASFSLIFPIGLRPVYRIWMSIAEVLGWINTRIILGLIFYIIFVPTGLLMRLFKDPLHRKIEKDMKTYRVISQSPKSENMERPF